MPVSEVWGGRGILGGGAGKVLYPAYSPGSIGSQAGVPGAGPQQRLVGRRRHGTARGHPPSGVEVRAWHRRRGTEVRARRRHGPVSTGAAVGLEPSGGHGGGEGQRACAAFAPTGSPPTDQDVAKMLEEERLRKYG